MENKDGHEQQSDAQADRRARLVPDGDRVGGDTRQSLRAPNFVERYLPPWLRPLFPYAASIALVLLAAATASVSVHLASSAGLTLIFLVAVVISANRFGLWPSVFTSVLSVLCWDFFFTLPYYSLTLDDPTDVFALIAFLTAALIISGMTAQIQRQSEHLEAAGLERTRLAREFEHVLMTAETERIRNALLTSVSHDLRTPLTTIIGALSTLKLMGTTFSPAIRNELMETARREAERLDRFVGNLLDITRLEGGSIRARLVSLDASEVLESALERAQSLIDDRTLDVEIPDDVPAVRADYVLLEQVFFNVIDNAAKYSPPCSTISIGLAADDAFVRVRIADEGPGIPPEACEKIFEKFTRIEQGDSRTPGTGLGLMICRGFLAIMHGTIKAANRTDRTGAVFEIALPRA